jgi:hypothetical protein
VRTLDPNDAPDGHVAVACNIWRICSECAFAPGYSQRKWRPCRIIRCLPQYRVDRCNVIFKKKETTSDNTTQS